MGWEIGLLRGLQHEDVDLTGADLLVGTSAGSVVSAQVACGVDLEAMFQRQLEPSSGEIPASAGLVFGLRLVWTMVTAGGDAQRYRAKLGGKAMRSRTVPESERLAAISHRLESHEWPDRKLLITAVDASDGSFVVFDGDSDATLVEAVAASCAVPMVWPPVTIGGRRFIDGGMRSGANADLASGYDRVVIVAPIDRGGRISPGPGAQADGLRGRGSPGRGRHARRRRKRSHRAQCLGPGPARPGLPGRSRSGRHDGPGHRRHVGAMALVYRDVPVSSSEKGRAPRSPTGGIAGARPVGNRLPH